MIFKHKAVRSRLCKGLPALPATAYNITYSKLLPGALAVVAIVTGNALFSALALIWFVHIGVDRMLGYGLKYPEGFKVTHLGTIGQMGGEPSDSYLPCGK
ncbi:MAG: DUF4260 domain-containing protein [Glaciimonas sp.]|nr:DUF4260 domain-containing protein [Glaciimonas sp.]